MIIKFKNKKTCKRLRLVNSQKGGSKNKPNVKMSLKTLKKMIKTAAKLQITSDYVTRQTQSKNYYQLQQTSQPKKSFSNLKNTEFQHVAHLVPNKNYWFTASALMNANKLEKKYKKYSKNHVALDDILGQYVASKQPINNTNKTILYKKLYSALGHKDDNKNKEVILGKIAKLLHPSS